MSKCVLWGDEQRGAHLWQVSCHLLRKTGGILPLFHIVQLIEEPRCPLIQQGDYIRCHLVTPSQQSVDEHIQACMEQLRFHHQQENWD
jgi:hypothetical protein